MPSRQLSIIEPHPTVPRSGSYLSGGRGGAGNYRRYNAADLTSGPTATGPPSRSRLFGSAASKASPPVPQHPQHLRAIGSTGIGGAGNMFARAETEERVFQFDEEMMLRRDATQAPVYHIGRGGGGNWVHAAAANEHAHDRAGDRQPSQTRTERLGSTSSNASSSGASTASSRSQARRSVEGALGRLKDRFTS